LVRMKVILRCFEKLFGVEGKPCARRIFFFVMRILPPFIPSVHDPVLDALKTVNNCQLPLRNKMTVNALNNIGILRP